MLWLTFDELKKVMDDCISRQAVLDKTIRVNSIWKSITNIEGKNIEEILSELPSVNPQEPKTGHWIEHPTEEEYSVCSCCGIGCRRKEHGKNADGTIYIDIYSYRFCPYCGCRMVEPQESEDEEGENE